MSKSSVFLVSGDIRSGKTTWLRHWMGLKKTRGVQFAGLVSLDSTPVSELNAAKYLQSSVQKNLHLRRLLNVKNQQSIEFEIELGKEGNLPVIKVGRFVFSKKAFLEGIEWLHQGLEEDGTDWLLLDEVGKLELHRNEGFEPQLSEFFSVYTKTVEIRRALGKSYPKLLVVVRKELLQDFIDQHAQRLPEYEVLNFEELNSNEEFQIPGIPKKHRAIHGLVLGGGQSSRMGFPKFRKVYANHTPQWKRLALAMQGLVDFIGINIPRNEEKKLDQLNAIGADLSFEFSWEFDEDEWCNSGPIGGILSYYHRHKALDFQALLVVAVDYPNLRDSALNELVDVFSSTNKSVFYFDDSTNIINGLIGVYTKSDLKELEAYYQSGKQSLSGFLKQKAPAIYLLTPQNWSELNSVDE